VPQLAHSVEAKPELVITEGIAYTKFLLDTDSNFKFMLGPRVRHDLPVVNPIHKRTATYHSPEQVVGFE